MTLQQDKEYLIKKWNYEKQLIKAFKQVKRENFVLKQYKEQAYQDIPLPILKNQTISQPSTVMLMTNALDLQKNNKILEIGSGSGYQSAILSKLAKKIYTIEIIPELTKLATKNLKDYKNVKVIQGDGSLGYAKEKPYNRIIVTAACPSIPYELIDQLKPNGILIAPIGTQYQQKMIKITKTKDKIKEEYLGDFIFVKLKGKKGWK